MNSEALRTGRLRALTLAALLLLIEPVVFALDPFLITTATSDISSRLTDRISAPFVGYDADEPDKVSLASKSVGVVLIDQTSLDRLSLDRVDPFTEFEIYMQLLQFKPKLIVSDQVHNADTRGALNELMPLLKEESERAGVPIIFNDGESAGFQSAHPVVAERFPLSAVVHSATDKTYPLLVPYLDVETGDFRSNLALSAIMAACPEWDRAARLRGCREIDALRASRAEAHIQYGSLHNAVWAQQGALVGLTGSDFHEKARKLPPGCRYFEADFWSRLREGLLELAGSFTPVASPSQLANCPYPPSVTGEQVLDGSLQANAYLREALVNKIVFVSFDAHRPNDKVPLLSADAPAVYAHAMTTVNLLQNGVDHLRPAADLAVPIAETLGVKRLDNMNIQEDVVAETAASVVLVLTFFGLFYRGAAAERSRRRGTMMLIAWYGLFFVVVGVGNVVAFGLLGWPGFNWVGSLLYADGVRLIVTRALEESGDARRVAGGALERTS